MLPFYLSDGSNPRASDSRWFRWTKLVSASNDICGSVPADHTSLNDTQANLEAKMLCAVDGIACQGFALKRTETRRDRLKGVLNGYLATCGGAAANHERKTDTWRILEQKILATVTGQVYNG